MEKDIEELCDIFRGRASRPFVELQYKLEKNVPAEILFEVVHEKIEKAILNGENTFTGK